jgi:hypothetical protein
MTQKECLTWEFTEPGYVACGDARLSASKRREDLDGRIQVSLVIGDEAFTHDVFPEAKQVRGTVEAILSARNLPPLPEAILSTLEQYVQS